MDVNMKWLSLLVMSIAFACDDNKSNSNVDTGDTGDTGDPGGTPETNN